MLTKKSKYALKALVYISRQPLSTFVSANEIATHFNISHKFLETILNELSRVLIIKSKKGKNGGYQLNKTADEIDMLTILRLFDGPIALTLCVSEGRYEHCQECTNNELCGLRNVAQEIKNLMVVKYKETTIANLVEREQKLVSLQTSDDTI
jgi:Rrf2 family protein